ncbi:phenylacetic acid degradation bifunctional protein PaaZ [Thermus scotoductus]|uniref:phenylacetic acid degradation bifunctional protein PaaZ n=1 Tax=Thermus scotoductus TaxID=37636 RepID=UPI000F807679|nr:phenylacetic acid degradation bifunctional protein PaaZ [Thermus scotoductus]RTI30351.1 phenylacetic acid degradation bifunctional protein PaaZ [Thermus scotoductus]
MKVKSYLMGQWLTGAGEGVPVQDAATLEVLGHVTSEGLPLKEAVAWGREVGGKALLAMGFQERGRRLRALAQYLSERKEELYRLYATTGGTRRDAWYDVDGGIGVLFTYSSLARMLPEGNLLPEEESLPLSKDFSFQGRHLLGPKGGITVQINAFNFPVWGLLEKFAPAFLAGVPTLAKPATATAHVAEGLVRLMVESGLLPEGSLQFVAGSLGDALEALDHRDSVYFTGSKATADRLKRHPAFLERGVLFNAETDSLNAAILGEKAGEEEVERLTREIAQELSIKTGQRCTAIRRVLVPQGRLEALLEATRKHLEGLKLGDPREEGVDLGPLASLGQKEEVERAVEALLAAGARVYWQHPGRRDGAFFPPTLLLAEDPWAETLHQVEPFGPVATFFPYRDREEALRLARLGGGMLAATLATLDPEEARFYRLGLSGEVGRLHILNRFNAHSSTGHGSPLPRLLHGGPGRAGGGEELGGLLSVKRHLARLALQADPHTLQALTGEYARGAEKPASTHPFRKYYEELEVGETLWTHRRTVTEADIALFAHLSWDHFYAHTDEIAAQKSLFGKRVAHGYFVLSAAAGLFVDPAPGPVLANYGLEGLRFTEPVGIGDTLQARLTVKAKRPRDEKSGVVEWAVEVVNQEGKTVAAYTILTLVARKPTDALPSGQTHFGASS